MKLTAKDVKRIILEELALEAGPTDPDVLKVGDVITFHRQELHPLPDGTPQSNVQVSVNTNEDIIDYSPEALHALATELERASRLMRVWASKALSERQEQQDGKGAERHRD